MPGPHQQESLAESHPHQPKRRQVFEDTPFPSFAQQQTFVQDSFFSASVYYCAHPNLLGCSSAAGKAATILTTPSSDDATRTPPAVDGRLTKIKLLRIKPSAQTASNISTAVSYSLETFNWSSHPDFIALSYVWGTDDANNSILVNGKKYSIQKNLHSALSQFTRENRSTCLWADAICIDQTDEEEKSHVVQHMGDIFSRASRVIAWLGPVEPSMEPSQPGQSDLIDHLECLGSLFWKKSGAGTRKLNEVSPDLAKTLKLCLPELQERFGFRGDGNDLFPVSAYTQFSNNPYWQRIWVLQEAYLAQDLWFHCGPKAISMRTLFATGSPSFPEMHRLIIYTSIYPAGIVSLRVAMANFCIKELPRGSRATDPRDMVFGLLGSATEHEKEHIKADYTKPVQDVYRDVTRALVSHGFADVLSWSQRSQKQILNLPSWVPDFSSTIYEPLCSQGQSKPWLPRFDASAGRAAAIWSSAEDAEPSSNILSLLGVTLHEVSSIGGIWYPRDNQHQYHSENGLLHGATMCSRSASYAAIRKFLDEIRKLSSAPAIEGSELKIDVNEEIACRVACADQLVLDSKLSRAPTDGTDSRDYYLGALRAVENHLNHERDERLDSKARPYLETLLRWVKKRPFRTRGGHMGLAPAEIKPGDLVVIFPGFSAPYVLRRVGNKARTYEMVGECYVCSVMDGEYLGAVETVFDLFHLA
ncbi:heterokaryon incompatibility protein-domain-containing protein [Podospora aff. communis PSN243]|uniref:Heterokaryon incompatibility protein-domain-containing protein n=1 Tax=Podospora aff. communis PSN243 TaxID=3040156 RepID=A0AAV9GTC7_9PEZI|nr:heterokaryon incompatibility protein-domain-containing protein [Podospora aff. communis PSN243]